jgi:hypothetical protein
MDNEWRANLHDVILIRFNLRLPVESFIQTALNTNFSLVLGTWYSTIENIEANCSPDQLQFGPWYMVLCFWEGYIKRISLQTIVWSLVFGTLF